MATETEDSLAKLCERQRTLIKELQAKMLLLQMTLDAYRRAANRL